MTMEEDQRAGINLKAVTFEILANDILPPPLPLPLKSRLIEPFIGGSFSGLNIRRAVIKHSSEGDVPWYRVGV